MNAQPPRPSNVSGHSANPVTASPSGPKRASRAVRRAARWVSTSAGSCAGPTNRSKSAAVVSRVTSSHMAAARQAAAPSRRLHAASQTANGGTRMADVSLQVSAHPISTPPSVSHAVRPPHCQRTRAHRLSTPSASDGTPSISETLRRGK